MQTRAVALTLCLLFITLLAFGQVGNGTITGTVSDQAGAVVAGAPVQIKNVDTGVVYSGASSTTGNYTISDLPVGKYSITVTVQGFKGLHPYEPRRGGGTNPQRRRRSASRQLLGVGDRHSRIDAAEDRNR